MKNEVRLSGTLKRGPEMRETSSGKQKAWAILEFEPYPGAQKMQSVALEGWGVMSEKVMQLREGTYVDVEGQLNCYQIKTDSGEYKNMVSIQVKGVG